MNAPERGPTPTDPRDDSLVQRVVAAFLHGNLSILLMILALAMGVVALVATPREEEPQIVVPLADVIVQAPGASAAEVERQVSLRLEKLLYQIDGVEYVYSMSRPGMAIVTVRFFVGQNREESLLKLYNKVYSNQDQVPPIVTGWVVKPMEIDDVPIVSFTFTGGGLDEYALRRIAEETEARVQAVAHTGRTFIVGGQARRAMVRLDTGRMAAHGISPGDIEGALRATNVSLPAGSFARDNRQVLVTAGEALRSVHELPSLVVGVSAGRPVYLRDVAQVTDGPDEVESYTRIGFGPAARFTRLAGGHAGGGAEIRGGAGTPDHPAVTLAVAKKKGANAVRVAHALEAEVAGLRGGAIPAGVDVVITRDFGETANEKVNELVNGLALAVATVIVLLAFTLGWREAFIVAVAIPIVYALTLFVNYLFGYTINRVTLFALILALGLLVDDPIVDVENIYRHLRMRVRKPLEAVLFAVNEVRPPVILATLAVIVSFLPMFFITGMMGPYMRPMAVNVPLAMLMSMVVAFTITPWMSHHLLKGHAASGDAAGGHDGEGAPPGLLRFFTAVLSPFLRSRSWRRGLVAAILLMLALSGLLVVWRLVPLKMLPFDNKNEFQVVLDMPEGTPLERTAAAAAAVAARLRAEPEVACTIAHSGVPSPMDFNGLVRHYYFRTAPHQADIRVLLAPKHNRTMQSHDMLLRVRRAATAVAERHGALLQLVEMPPGPPVIATLTAEVYGDSGTPYPVIQSAARDVKARLARVKGVVEADSTVEAEQAKLFFELDREKAALSGVSAAEVAATLGALLGGRDAGALHSEHEVNPLTVRLRLPRPDRSSVGQLEGVYVKGRNGEQVQLGEIGRFRETTEDQTIYHKNLERVAYVFADTAGRAPAEAVFDIQDELKQRPTAPGTRVTWSGEGEWKITLDVFRDLGIAFAAALFGIYILLVYNTGSYLMPVIIMMAIPLTVIGIMPGFALLNGVMSRPVGGFENPVFFTATAMIGMIALAGIVVRNSIILIDFIHVGQRRGLALRDAIIQSAAVRARPIFLTAAAALLGAWPITLDPIFSGLAWSLIFGLVVSTAFSLVVIPVAYWTAYGAAEKPARADELENG